MSGLTGSHHDVSKRKWIMPLVIVVMVIGMVGLALCLRHFYNVTHDMRLEILTQNTQIKSLENRLSGGLPALSAGGGTAKRESRSLGLFEQPRDRPPEEGRESPLPATSRDDDNVIHDRMYEFSLPSQGLRIGESIRVPPDRGSSVPGLDIPSLVSYDVCCRLEDGSFSCARGVDVSRSVPSMSANLQSDASGSQFLSLRISTTAAYAGRTCLLRFSQRQ